MGLHTNPCPWSKTVGTAEIAFRSDTPEEIQFTWKHVIKNGWLEGSSYPAKSEDVNDNCAFVGSYPGRYRKTLAFKQIEPTIIERLIRGFFGADLFQKIIDVVEPA